MRETEKLTDMERYRLGQIYKDTKREREMTESIEEGSTLLIRLRAAGRDVLTLLHTHAHACTHAHARTHTKASAHTPNTALTPPTHRTPCGHPQSQVKRNW